MSTLAPRPAAASVVETAQLLMPGDANALGGAFGGSVIGWIDICAAISAQRHCRQIVVTASMDDLHFHAPIKVAALYYLQPWLDARRDELAVHLAHATHLGELGHAWAALAFLLPEDAP